MSQASRVYPPPPPPLSLVDPKEKAPETPSSKPQKKMKKANAFVEGVPNKAKLLASAISVVRTAKVYFTLLFKFMLCLEVLNYLTSI